MTVLGARFGALEESRYDGVIDSLAIRLSDFSSANEKGPKGMAASVSNSAGQYWAFACYKKGGEFFKGFCGDAIATAARAGGLAYVEAKELQDFGDGKIKAPASCTSTPGSKISCNTGTLSWSPKGGPSAETLRDETLARLRGMATKEKVKIEEREITCKLLGKSASCLYLRLASKAKSEALHFVLATGGKQGRLVVCAYPKATAQGLPEPCAQALELRLPSP